MRLGFLPKKQKLSCQKRSWLAKLEFLADMNISPLTVNQLRKLGWNIVRVSELMNIRSKDIEILVYAQKYNKVLITQDLDFSLLLAFGKYKKPSIINIRLKNPKPVFVTQRIMEVVPDMVEELEKGVVISVSEIHASYRILPVKVD